MKTLQRLKGACRDIRSYHDVCKELAASEFDAEALQRVGWQGVALEAELAMIQAIAYIECGNEARAKETEA